MNYKTLLGLGLTTLIALGASCASTDTNTNTVTTNTVVDEPNTSLLVPVDPDSDVEETVVVDDGIAEEIAEEDEAVTEDAEEEDTEEDAEETEETVTAPTTQTFDIVASQFEFSPSTITVTVGDTVVLNLTTSDVPHGFSLPQFGASATITPGQTKTVEFVADEAGTFTFRCSVVCGSGHSSMSGQIIVN